MAVVTARAASCPQAVRAGILALAMIASAGRAEVRYTITDLGSAAFPTAYPNAINQAGQVVGSSAYNRNVLLWDHADPVDLGIPRSNVVEGAAINNFAAVAGFYDGDRPYVYHAFLWQGGALTDLGQGRALGINDAGLVVGGTGGDNSGDPVRAVLWQGGTRGDLTDMARIGGLYTLQRAFAVNNNGQIAGTAARIGGGAFAFIWENSSATILQGLGGMHGQAIDINDSGAACGVDWAGGTTQSHGFLYSAGVTTDLGTLDGTSDSWSMALGLNNQEQVVGYGYLHGNVGGSHACLWDDGAIADLQTLVAPDSRWTLERASAINDSGLIVGSGTYHFPNGSSESRAFLLTPVPEPATMGLLALGALALARRRRK